MAVLGRPPQLNAEQKRHTIRLYVEERWWASWIARAFDVDPGTIRHILRSAGIPLRLSRHGLYHTPAWWSWWGMKQRCLNPRATDYRLYGGRGITIFQGWRDSFSVFLSDMGERPNGKTLDRIDVDGPYEKANCRWATLKEQRANRRGANGRI